MKTQSDNNARSVPLHRFVRRWWPLMTLKAAADGWWITGPDGNKTYLWLHFGPQVSPDGLRIWTLTIGPLAFAIGFRGQTPNSQFKQPELH